jgi:hypothetical protein
MVFIGKIIVMPDDGDGVIDKFPCKKKIQKERKEKKAVLFVFF